TAKGRATRAGILDAAHEVIKAKGFYGASISEIARRRGVSMGTFYKYFKNKEQAFQELNDLIISRFMARTASISMEGLSFIERLRKNIRILFDHTRDNLAFHCILGESELIDRVTIAYYESIARYYRDFFRREARAGNILPLDPNIIAYGLIGVCYFHSMDWRTGEARQDPATIVDLIVDVV
ncbi:MAG: TetR/AcrR family transcriptional regulator, partial [Desulfobacterales bacterium]|nr:TetR/AcrR family transcriptional regulator [Desulfobacterales bacterium]